MRKLPYELAAESRSLLSDEYSLAVFDSRMSYLRDADFVPIAEFVDRWCPDRSPLYDSTSRDRLRADVAAAAGHDEAVYIYRGRGRGANRA